MWRARETHSGGFALGDGGTHLDRPITLSLAWQLRSLRDLRRDGIELDGEVHVPGFADHCRARGRLRLDPRRTLRYQVDFEANSGVAHRLDGERRLSLAGFPAAVTLLRGRIVDAEGQTVGRALLRFDLRNDLWQFLRSIEYESPTQEGA